MSYDYKDFQKLAVKKHLERRHGGDFNMLHQAALRMEHLTGHESWDKYLSIIQSDLEAVNRQIEDWTDRLSSRSVVDHTEMMVLKLALAEAKGRVSAWEYCLELPRKIVEERDRIQRELSTPGDTQSD